MFCALCESIGFRVSGFWKRNGIKNWLMNAEEKMDPLRIMMKRHPQQRNQSPSPGRSFHPSLCSNVAISSTSHSKQCFHTSRGTNAEWTCRPLMICNELCVSLQFKDETSPDQVGHRWKINHPFLHSQKQRNWDALARSWISMHHHLSVCYHHKQMSSPTRE